MSRQSLLRLEPSVASPDEGDGDLDESSCFGDGFQSFFFAQGIVTRMGRRWDGSAQLRRSIVEPGP
ncbi:hypothetical protein [Bosea sp. 117]|uniref:hypothetical protein n=1 Tax=Hyphomicrobiales TaxID=356 RepID=UPI00049427E2|nr:hypothetical protein [Bosea sp. 117]